MDMRYGICDLAVLPQRSEPSNKAEMVNQLLFGDIFEVLELHNNWGMIRNQFDQYSGWIELDHVPELQEEEYHKLNSASLFVSKELLSDIVSDQNHTIRIPAGSSLFNLDNSKMAVAGRNYFFSGTANKFKFDSTGELLNTARKYLSCPYLWGGRTCLGLDCSGYTQVVFKQHGIKLLRDASQQSGKGEPVSFLSDSRSGDLAFFDDDQGEITHVGIIIDQTKIIHCSGRVKINMIDHHGIFDQQRKKYTHKLRLIRRMV
jgi:hypothetical protein